MLTFFRRIRLRLLGQASSDTERKAFLGSGQASRYILYAIGEIALVVIGILIALQINNWNEWRKNEKIKLKMVHDLSNELHSSQQQLSAAIRNIDLLIEDGLQFLEYIANESGKVSVDSLKKLASFATTGVPFDPIFPSYQEANSTGRLSLLENSELLKGYSRIFAIIEGYKLHRKIGAEVFYFGSGLKWREELGQSNVINDPSDEVQEIFRLSDREYLDFVRQPSIYANLENSLIVLMNTAGYMHRMSEAYEDVIALLEST